MKRDLVWKREKKPRLPGVNACVSLLLEQFFLCLFSPNISVLILIVVVVVDEREIEREGERERERKRERERVGVGKWFSSKKTFMLVV